jgi:N-glycosylase/DNA lyase
VESSEFHAEFPLRDYDVAATLASGQAFRWKAAGDTHEGIIGNRWVRLQVRPDRLRAETSAPAGDWRWLTDYLQLAADLPAIVASFPDDAPLRSAVSACPGLRLLRQDHWECLASFILSSTKQIVQIQQCVGLLCERFGERIAGPDGEGPFSFPSFTRLAAASEAELRACKLGFRAKYLRGTAQMLAAGEVALAGLRDLPTEEARAQLMRFPGVGRKIADCVLLFAYGRQDAFPVDVWVLKALRTLYFPNRRPTLRRLQHFAATYFGPNAGYAQQYLFHYVRTQVPELRARGRKRKGKAPRRA